MWTTIYFLGPKQYPVDMMPLFSFVISCKVACKIHVISALSFFFFSLSFCFFLFFIFPYKGLVLYSLKLRTLHVNNRSTDLQFSLALGLGPSQRVRILLASHSASSQWKTLNITVEPTC